MQSRRYNKIQETIKISTFSIVFLLSILTSNNASAQSTVSTNGTANKDELSIDAKVSLNRQLHNGHDKQQISVDEKDKTQKTQRAAIGTIKKPDKPWFKFDLNTKNGTSKSKRKTKKVFTREFGLVDMPPAPTDNLGTLSLEDCVNIAVENHIPLQVAKKSITLAEMRVYEARRNMLPSISIGFEESSGKVLGRYYAGRKQFIEGQQPIYRGGELYYTMKQSVTNLEIVKSDYDRVKNELVLQVKKAYYSLCKTKGNLQLQQDLAKEVDKIVEMVTKQNEAAIAAKMEVLNVTQQAAQVKYQLFSAEGDVAVAEVILKQAMNVDERQPMDIIPSLEFKKIKVDFDTALHAALMNRPEMKINSLMLDYYNYGRGIAKAKTLPKIDLLGSWGLAKEEFLPRDQGVGDADQRLEQQWYGGIKASMPIWGSTAEYSVTREQWTPVVSAYQGTESKTTAYKLKLLDKLDIYSDKMLADIDFERARQELNKIKQEVNLEIKEGCFSYHKALLQLDTATNKVMYQERDLELNKLKRGLDEAQDSNIIDSMIKLAQERFAYMQALMDCHTSLATINKAIGVENYFVDEPPAKIQTITQDKLGAEDGAAKNEGQIENGK